ncbi:MAG: fused MFS/spermidine synthase [Sedimentisphaerales bacterium]|jgi:tetratricopeptide (TPR) repeat protein/MFS family permease
MQNKDTAKSKFKSFSLILIPSATVFISSFCVMVLELVAGRLTARQLGSSLYTWTSVIGVVLAGITIGYYTGGRIADRFNAKKALSSLFAIGSAACVATVIFSNVVSGWIFLWTFGWSFRVFTHVSLLFLLPSILLGTISPVVAKMALDKRLPQGRTVGDIYAWGAAGSIAGTFAAGFYLIATIGTIALIWAVGAGLLLMALLYRPRFWPLHLWAALFLFILIVAVNPAQWSQAAGTALLLREPEDPRVLYQDESQYCYIAVRQTSTNPDRRNFMQDKLLHSVIIMGDINNLQYFYERIYAGITHAISGNKNKLAIMAIGGGGYVFPRYLEHNWPGSRIDVAEIDPRVTKAATEAFGLRKDTVINTINMDARNYVDELLEKQRNGGKISQYDLIYEDALNDYSIPYQLVTREFNDKIAGLLADDGAYLIELIDIYDSGQFLGAVINTLQRTFPYVYVAADQACPPSVRETFVVVATKRPFDIKAVGAQQGLKIWHLSEAEIENLKKKAHGIVLTDDYTPVENLLAPVVRQSAEELLANTCMRRAQQLQAQGKWDKSIRMYEKALQLNPQMAVKAYSEIGTMLVAQNNLQKAIWAFQNAIDSNDRLEAENSAIGSIHLNLGILLDKMGKYDESRQQLVKAVDQFHLEMANEPNSALLWCRLGETFATMGDFKSASDSFEKAVALEPDNVSYWYSLARAFELQNNITDAIETVKKAIELTSGSEQKEATAELNTYLKRLEHKKSTQQP